METTNNLVGSTSTYVLNTQTGVPKRQGKQYETREECLKENETHVWSEPFDPNPGMSCLVYHSDGHCGWHDPKQICLHCPAERHEIIKQREIKEWLEN